MARDGVFFRFAKRIHPAFRTPSGALIFLGSVAALLALSGTYEGALFSVCFCRVIFFALTAITPLSFAQKRTQPVASVPRLGPSLDHARLFGCPRGSELSLVDGPAGALLAGPGSHPGWRPPFFYYWRKQARNSTKASE